MNTLTGIEAERVSQILRHAIDRLHIMSYVPTHWDDDLATGIHNAEQLSCAYWKILKLISSFNGPMWTSYDPQELRAIPC